MVHLPIKPKTLVKGIGILIVLIFLKSLVSVFTNHVQPPINARSKYAPPLLKAAGRVYPEGECHLSSPTLLETTQAVSCSFTSPPHVVTYEQIPPHTNISTLDHEISTRLSEEDIPISCAAFGSTKWRLPHTNVAGVVVCNEYNLVWCDPSTHLVGHIEQSEEEPPTITSFWPQAITVEHPHANAPIIDQAATKRNTC